jgi:hypothetical protein
MEVVGRKSCVPSAGSCCAFVLLRGVAASVCWCSAVLCCLSQTCGDVPRGWCRSGVSGRPQTRFPDARVHFTGAGIMQQPDRISHNSPQPSLKPHPSPILGDTSPRLAPFLYCSAADCAAPLFPFVLTLFLSLLCLFLDLPSAFYILSACEPYGLPVNTSPQPPLLVASTAPTARDLTTSSLLPAHLLRPSRIMPSLKKEKRGGLTLEKLASYDDVITDALVDKVNLLSGKPRQNVHESH